MIEMLSTSIDIVFLFKVDIIDEVGVLDEELIFAILTNLFEIYRMVML